MKKPQRNVIHRNYSDFRKNYSSTKSKQIQSKRKYSIGKIIGIVSILLILFSVPAYAYFHVSSVKPIVKPKVHKIITPKPVVAVVTPSPVTPAPAVATVATTCSTNTLNQVIITSISQRHLWACTGNQLTYDTAVITGDMNIVEDASPIGTFHIYGKYTNLHLRGSDSKGSWDDPVSFWMPFLSNQYGVFGIHDASWRAPTDFGNISAYSSDASHGCIETSVAAGQWLYNWSSIGTTVIIES